MAINYKEARNPQLMHNPLRYLCKREGIFDDAPFRHFFLKERFAKAKSLYRRDFKSHYGCVNAIEFSDDGFFIVSGGDDRRVLLWNVEKALSDIGEPLAMKGEHHSNIFCLAINPSNTKIYSGGNDEQVVLHDIASGQTEDVFRHEEAVYGLSTNPASDSVFASACDDGRVLVYDIREPPSTDPVVLASYSSSMHAVMFNPADPRLLATANAKEGVALWDIRKPRNSLIRYGGRYLQQSCMSVRINSRGSHLVALRRRLPPVLYELSNTHPLCDMDYEGYYNSCTMKSCSFAGPNDEYVLSGSDDFNLYMWKIPDDLSQRVYVKQPHMVLRGHRSIVNQVRYNKHNGLIISSGVEKIIKVWSPFKLHEGTGGIHCDSGEALAERPVFTHEEYINLVLRSGLVMSHDYTTQSMEEDPRMMAFFDSLVQRELEYWSSEEEFSPNEIELYDSILQVTNTAQEEGEAAGGEPDLRGNVSDSSDNSEFSPFTLAFASVMASQDSDMSRVLDAHLESERLGADVSRVLDAHQQNEHQGAEVSRVLDAHQQSQSLGADVSRVLDSHLESERPGSTSEDLCLPGSSDFGARHPPAIKRRRKANRKSISEIIAQNRREVMRAAEMRSRGLKATRPSPPLLDGFLSSSSSDWDCEDAGKVARVKVEDVRDALQSRARATQRRAAASRLKRLHSLRMRLVNSETEDSGGETPKRKKARTASHSSKEDAKDGCNIDDSVNVHDLTPDPGDDKPAADKDCCNSASSELNLAGTSTVAVVHTVPKGKAGFEHEAGPYLQQTDGPPALTTHLPSLSSSSSSSSSSSTPTASHSESGASTSTLSFSSPSHPEGMHADSESFKVSEHSSCDNSDGPHCSQPTPTAHQGQEQSEEDNSQPVWNEFTKFKKRLKRASRYFRQRMQANDSSDDD